MVNIVSENLVNNFRDWLYDAWSQVWDSVLEKAWKTKNFGTIKKEFQKSLFEYSLDGERVLEKDKLEELPAIFQALEKIDSDFKASDEVKKNLKLYREDFIRYIFKYTLEKKDYLFLRELLDRVQDPKFTLELDYEEESLEDPEHPGKKLRFKLVPRKEIEKVIIRLHRGWRVIFRKDDEIVKDSSGKDIETEIEITDKSLNKIFRLIELKYFELPKLYKDLYTGEEVWIPYKIIKRNGKEYLKLKLVRPKGANILLTLFPSKDIFRKLAESMDLYILQNLWLAPVSKAYPATPVGIYQAVAHWFQAIEDLPKEKQVTVPQAINQFLGAEIFDASKLEHEQIAKLVDYFIPSKVPLLFFRIDKDALDAILKLYSTKPFVKIESQELKIKPAKIEFEVKKEEKNKDKEKEEKIYRKVSEGSEITPQFVADASLDLKKMIMYKLTFKVGEEEKTFFMLRLTGTGSKDTVYLGKLLVTENKDLSEKANQ